MEKIPGQLEASFLIFLTFGSIKVLKAGPSWVKLKIREWKRPRGFTVRGLSIKQTNKQTNKQKACQPTNVYTDTYMCTYTDTDGKYYSYYSVCQYPGKVYNSKLFFCTPRSGEGVQI